MWGECDPKIRRTAAAAARILVGSAEAGRHHRARRYAAGPARAAVERPRRGARRRALHPRPCRPYPRHRRPAHGRLRHEAAGRLLFRCADPREPAVAAFRLLLQDAARLRTIPPILRRATISCAGRARRIDGQGRSRSPPCPCRRSTAISRRSVSVSAASPIRRMSAMPAELRKPPCRTWMSGSSTPCATRRTRAISASSRRSNRSSGRSQARDPHPHDWRSRLRDAASATCRPTSSPPTTAWSSS